jgi:hypothetical protein
MLLPKKNITDIKILYFRTLFKIINRVLIYTVNEFQIVLSFYSVFFHLVTLFDHLYLLGNYRT